MKYSQSSTIKGLPLSSLTTTLGKEVINVTKKVRGDMALVTEKGLQLTGAKFGETGKAVSKLQDFIEVEIGGNKIQQSRLHAAIEGIIKV